MITIRTVVPHPKIPPIGVHTETHQDMPKDFEKEQRLASMAITKPWAMSGHDYARGLVVCDVELLLSEPQAVRV